MALLVRHRVCTVPNIDHSDKDDAQDVPILVAGRMMYFHTTATCNDERADVSVSSYTPISGGPFIDQSGYRPALGPTVAPKYLKVGEMISSGVNPLPFFDIGVPARPQALYVTATAFKEPCGTWNASGPAPLVIPPVSIDPLNLYSNTMLGSFVISEDTRFGFGTENTDPGFNFKQNVEWTQTGWFGVIHLFSGTYSYQVAGAADWFPIINEPAYVLDVPDGAQDPVQKMKIRTGFLKVQFTDSPAIDVKSFVKAQPDVVAFSIDATFKTYLMFNPSDTADPTTDTSTMWYPFLETPAVQSTVQSAVQWEISGVAQYDPARGKDKTKPDAWIISADTHEMEPIDAIPLPTWEGVTHKVSHADLKTGCLTGA